MPKALSKMKTSGKSASRLRTQRIDLRADPEVKAIIEYAAGIRHLPVTTYLLDVAYQKAKEDIRAEEAFVLSTTDRKIFFDALLNPPEPNESLRALFRPAQD